MEATLITCIYNKDYIAPLLLDIKVYYHLQNAIFHEAAGRKEYCIPRVCSNKPDIQHSKGAIFVTLYSLHLHTNCVRDLKTQTMYSSKTTLKYQQRKVTMTIHTWL